MDLEDVRRDVRSLIDEWLDAGRFVPRVDNWIRGFDLEFSRTLGERGWIGMTWPRDLGGHEASFVERLAVTEELLASGAPVAAHWFADRQIGPALLRYGTRELQREFLPAMVRAEVTFAIGMSEPEAGSDLAAVSTSARATTNGWRVTGTKIWTSNAHRCTHAYLLARTSSDGDRHEGLTELIVDLSQEGIDIRPIPDLQGEHHFNEVHLEDVVVPADRVIGEVGNGWKQVTEQLSFERGGPERFLSTYPLLEALAQRFAGTGAPDVTEQIGALTARLLGLRQQARQVAVAMDRGEAPAADAAMLKLAGTEYEHDVVATARQLVTAHGLHDELLGSMTADALLSAPTFGLRGGASEVLLGIVGRSVARA